MIKIVTKMTLDRAKMQRETDRAGIRGLKKMGGFIRTTARRSIKVSKRNKPAAIGTPVKTRQTKQVKDSILFFVDFRKINLIVGTRFSKMGNSMKYHEHGGKRKGRRYQARPFMNPALKKAIPKTKQFFTNTFKK